MAVNSAVPGYAFRSNSQDGLQQPAPSTQHPAAPSVGPATPRSALLQEAAGSMPGYRAADARIVHRRKDEDADEDSGKSDSESAPHSDGEDDDAADRLAEAARQTPRSDAEDSGKSDSESAAQDDGDDSRTDAGDASEPTPPVDVDATSAPQSTSRPDQPSPSQAMGNEARDGLYTGVPILRSDELSVGAYLASGAFGMVFRGTWNGAAVALKQIDFEHARRKLPLSEEDIAESLQWEVSRLATTSHPNLVQFYGVCRKDGKTYLVLELCEGGSLQRVLEKGDIPDSRLWQWMREIADALAYLHGQGMLHRDLKAENVLIDKHGRAKLADLGVAQVDALLEDTETKALDMGLQDMAYIAPENVANVKEGSLRQSSKATDIYALGLVFWQMVSGGRAPTRWEVLLNSPDAIATMKAGERMPIPEDCPQPMRELIHACWRFKPAARPDIAEVLRLLRQMGPQLHPQAGTIELLEHLEASLHPKRQEARNYVPSQVTARRVEGRIEDYWAAQERAASAMPPTSTAATAGDITTTTSGASLQRAASATANPPLPLQQVLDDFLAQPHAGALLLLGESGLGKTLGMHVLAERLLQQWWRHLADPTSRPPRYLPVFLRAHVQEWSEAALKHAWTELAKRFHLQPGSAQPLVFIDGYDECRVEADQAMNLAARLGLPDDARMMVTCRPGAVKEEELEDRFACNGRLLTRHYLPFDLDQLLNYLKDRLAWDDATHAQYRARLQASSELRTVLRNPFVLYLLWQSWATVSRQPLEQLTRAQVYAGFIAHMVDKGSVLLAPGVRASLQGDAADLPTSHAAYTERVALLAARQNRYSLAQADVDQADSPWSGLPGLAREEARQRYQEREAHMEQLDASAQREHKRRMLLTLDDFIAMRQQAAAQMAAMLPLRLRDGVYEYAHKSVFEYCLARQLLKEVDHADGGMNEADLQKLLDWMIESAPESLLFADEFLGGAKAAQPDQNQGASHRSLEVRAPGLRLAQLFAAVGDALRAVERYEEAVAYHREALAIRVRTLGGKHADVSTSCNSLGLLLQDLGRYQEALGYFRRAVDIDEALFGTNHVHTAGSYNNIGLLLLDLDEHQKALGYLRAALAIDEHASAVRPLDIATCHNNISVILNGIGNHQEALEHLRKALAIREKALGADHAETATCYSNMALSLQRLGRYQEALALAEQALKIQKKT